MKIISDKILLRKPEPDDLEALYSLKNDEESSALLGGFSTGFYKEAISDWIKFHNKAANEVLYMIQDIESEKLIGHVGFYNINYRVRKAEFAILIADKNFRGKGYGDLCTKYMINYGFNQLNLNRIELSVLTTNINAIVLYEKNGFVKEGVQKQAQFKNGSYIDVILMANLRENL